jgi:lysozyme family protein
MKGSHFVATLPEKPVPEREKKILDAVRAGLSLPIEWFAIETSWEGHQGTIFVAADALAIGEPDDWVRVNVSHTTAQQIADVLAAALPTTKISDLAYMQATVVLPPCTQTPDDQMSYTSRMVRHHREIEVHRAGRAGLVRNVGKEWVLTNRLVGQPKQAANYGWFTPAGPSTLGSGLQGWQLLSIKHVRSHVDYSQTLCLVKRTMLVDGVERDLADVLRSPDLWGLVSDEGPLHIVRHPGVPEELPTPVVQDVPPGLRAMQGAEQELSDGIHEEPMGSNTGPRIRAYFADCVRDFPLPDGTIEQRRLGLTAGNWCAAFASYCGARMALPGEELPHHYRASVAELWKDAVVSGAARPPSYRPERGDLAIYARNGSNPTWGGLGHVGRVSAEPDVQGVYETIEGNHNDRVERVRHVLGDTVGWIAYGAAVATPAPREVAEIDAPQPPLQRAAVEVRAMPNPDLDAACWLIDLAAAIEGASAAVSGGRAMSPAVGGPGADTAHAFFAVDGAPAPEMVQLRSPTRAADHHEDEYRQLFANCVIEPAHLAEVDLYVRRIGSHHGRYEAVSATTGVPWYVIGIIHALECSLNFTRHLHNGDPLTARTTHVPAGRPPGSPPFTWEQSAVDALRLRALDRWKDWSVPGLLYKLEGYNGFGYRKVNPPIYSPYLWSYSNQYRAGKFVADGHYDPDAISRQCGGAVLLLRMEQTEIIPILPR